MAWHGWKRDHCSGCGGLKAETFDPANEWAYKGHVHACHRCAAMRREERKMDDLDGAYSYAVKR